jgi:hypothetical protein
MQEALAQSVEQGKAFRHESWFDGVAVRWDGRLGWLWRTKLIPTWANIPSSALGFHGLFAGPTMLAQGWSVVS